MKQSLLILTLITATGCATYPKPTPDQIKAEQAAELKKYQERLDVLAKMATNRRGEVDPIYMEYLLKTDPVIGLYRGPGLPDDTPAYTPAPTSGGYGNPVMVIPPTPGMMLNTTGGITTYNSGSTYCQSGYGVASCY